MLRAPMSAAQHPKAVRIEVTMKEWRDEMRAIAKDWLFSDVPEGVLPSRLVLPLENPDLHDPAPFEQQMTRVVNYRCVTVGLHSGEPVGLLSSKFAAPAVALAVEVVADMGVQRIVGVGYCGGLHADVACGHLIVPTRVLRDDGTTPHYVPSDHTSVASGALLERAREVARTARAPSKFGPIWSTDAILMETTERVSSYVAQGAIAVDMESGALYTVAGVRGVEAVSVLVASDHPGLQCRTDGERLVLGHREAIQLGFSLAIS
jgi:uridine phosphorylase